MAVADPDAKAEFQRLLEELNQDALSVMQHFYPDAVRAFAIRLETRSMQFRSIVNLWERKQDSELLRRRGSG
jgi:hypothetical protein